MRQLVVGVVAVVFLLSSGVGTASAQPTKTVSGTVTAVGPDSVTVKVKDQDMKFAVDKTTEVIARGGSTAERTAKAQGKSGPALSTMLKAGQSVEVKYHEAAMHAASIRVLPGAAPAAPAAPAPPAPTTGQSGKEKEKPKSETVSGTVTSMTGTSLTVKTSAGESTFAIDAKTKIIGTGLGTKTQEAAAAGKKQVLSDVVGVGDSVSVNYHDMAGAKQASEVRVRTKAAVK
jgi:uncharacterized protein DUF5666